MRRAAKIDINQPDIVDYVRRAGWRVHVTAPLGGGFPDFAASCGGFTALVEVKQRGGKLTLAEEDFRMKWQGAYIVGRTPEQTLHDLERARMEAE